MVSIHGGPGAVNNGKPRFTVNLRERQVPVSAFCGFIVNFCEPKSGSHCPQILIFIVHICPTGLEAGPD